MRRENGRNFRDLISTSQSTKLKKEIFGLLVGEIPILIRIFCLPTLSSSWSMNVKLVIEVTKLIFAKRLSAEEKFILI